MIEVHNKIYIGSESDCFYNHNDDWIVIHACKNPCHCKGVGYIGTLLNSHKEYLISDKGSHLFLNMVDMKKPLSPLFTHPIIKKP